MISTDGVLHQWDTGRIVILTDEDAEATEVHFAQYCSRADALITEVHEDGGRMVAAIPNSYLTDHKDLMIWTWRDDKTINGVRVDVIERNKPSDYVYTPTEVVNYEHLKQWLLDEFQRFEVAAATDYETLQNKPKINGVELVGDKDLTALGMQAVTDDEIDSLFA